MPPTRRGRHQRSVLLTTVLLGGVLAGTATSPAMAQVPTSTTSSCEAARVSPATPAPATGRAPDGAAAPDPEPETSDLEPPMPDPAPEPPAPAEPEPDPAPGADPATEPPAPPTSEPDPEPDPVPDPSTPFPGLPPVEGQLLADAGPGSATARPADRSAGHPLLYVVAALAENADARGLLAHELCTLAETGAKEELHRLAVRAGLLTLTGAVLVTTATVLRRRLDRRG